MLAIDRLIHASHWELVQSLGRSAARESIARRFTRVIASVQLSTPGANGRDGSAVMSKRP